MPDDVEQVDQAELPKDDFEDPGAVEHADQSSDPLPGSVS